VADECKLCVALFAVGDVPQELRQLVCVPLQRGAAEAGVRGGEDRLDERPASLVERSAERLDV